MDYLQKIRSVAEKSEDLVISMSPKVAINLISIAKASEELVLDPNNHLLLVKLEANLALLTKTLEKYAHR